MNFAKHFISIEVVKVGSDKVKVICKMRPIKIRHARWLLGVANYLNKFSPRFALIILLTNSFSSWSKIGTVFGT